MRALPIASDPATGDYQLIQIQGFGVHISPQFKARPQLQTAVLMRLSQKLEEAVELLGPRRSQELKQRVRFWLEINKSNSAMMYHPAKEWLKDNGYNTDKEHGIEVSNAEHFLAWSKSDQPLMVVHELAHAYLALILGNDYGPLKNSWEHANQNQLYKSVPYIHGQMRTAYALTNRDEFFAELTEAYFGANDYFPFNRSELKTYDSMAYQMMTEIWGQDENPIPLYGKSKSKNSDASRPTISSSFSREMAAPSPG